MSTLSEPGLNVSLGHVVITHCVRWPVYGSNVT